MSCSGGRFFQYKQYTRDLGGVSSPWQTGRLTTPHPVFDAGARSRVQFRVGLWKRNCEGRVCFPVHPTIKLCALSAAIVSLDPLELDVSMTTTAFYFRFKAKGSISLCRSNRCYLCRYFGYVGRNSAVLNRSHLGFLLKGCDAPPPRKLRGLERGGSYIPPLRVRQPGLCPKANHHPVRCNFFTYGNNPEFSLILLMFLQKGLHKMNKKE